MDHLLGKVFVDYLSNLKRSRIRAKLAKQAREHRPDAAPVRASLCAGPCASSLPARRRLRRPPSTPWRMPGTISSWC
jgi:DNA primase